MKRVSQRLYDDGWYTQAHYVKKCGSVRQMVQYMTDPCYDHPVAIAIIDESRKAAGLVSIAEVMQKARMEDYL